MNVFAEGGWLVPLLPFLGFVFFAFKAWKQHTGGSNKIVNGKVTDQEGGNIPVHKVPYFIYAAVCLVATIVIIWAFTAER